MTNKEKVFNNTFKFERKHFGESYSLIETFKFNDIILITDPTYNIIESIGRIVQIRKDAGKVDGDLVFFSKLDQTIGYCDSIYIHCANEEYLPLFEEMFADVEKELENQYYLINGKDAELGFIIPSKSIKKRSEIKYFFGKTQKFDIYAKKCPNFFTEGVDQANPKVPVLLTKRDEHIFIKDILYDDILSHCCHLVEYDFIHAKYYGLQLNSRKGERTEFPLLPEISFKVGKIIGMTCFEIEKLTNQSEFFVDFVTNNSPLEIAKILGIDDPNSIKHIEKYHKNKTLLKYFKITNVDGFLLEFEFYKLHDFSYSGDSEPISFHADSKQKKSKYIYSESYGEALFSINNAFEKHILKSSKKTN